MNNDIILEICIAGLNCRAGYATGCRSLRAHSHLDSLRFGLSTDIRQNDTTTSNIIKVTDTIVNVQALSTRIRIRLYPQTFYCGFKTLRVHSYPDLFRFRSSTRIRIRSEFNTRMFESLIEHALMNKLRRLP